MDKIIVVLKQLLSVIEQIVVQLKNLAYILLKAAIPVACGAIVSDIVLGTKFGVLEGVMNAGKSVGLSPIALLVVIAIIVVAWVKK